MRLTTGSACYEIDFTRLSRGTSSFSTLVNITGDQRNGATISEVCYSQMKRAAPWEQSYTISSDDSSDSDSDNDEKHSTKKGGSQPSTDFDSRKRRQGGMDYEALSRHGYHGGPSVLKVPPPKIVDDKEQDWSWSNGRPSSENSKDAIKEESYEERERTRAAANQVESLLNVQSARKDKNLSFSQKEKRKRDLGQASRGKNYVEEEKRLLRDSGVYSGFDA